MKKTDFINTWQNLINMCKDKNSIYNVFLTKWNDFYIEYFKYFSKSSFSLEEMVDKIISLTKEGEFSKPLFLPFGLVTKKLIDKKIAKYCDKLCICDNSKYGEKINGLLIQNPENIASIDYSHIIITSTSFCDSLTKQITSLGVEKRKIITPNALQYFKSINFKKAEEIAEKINKSPKDSLVFSCICLILSGLIFRTSPISDSVSPFIFIFIIIFSLSFIFMFFIES